MATQKYTLLVGWLVANLIANNDVFGVIDVTYRLTIHNDMHPRALHELYWLSKTA